MASDALLTGVAWVAAYYIRFGSGWIPVTKEQPDASLCWNSLPLVLILSAVAFQLTGQYTIHRLRRFREEMLGVLKGTMLLSLLVLATTFYRQDHYDSRATMLLFSGMTALAVLLGRRISWFIIRSLRRWGYNESRCIIVGTGRVARKTAWALRHASWMGIRNLGFVEDQPNRWTEDLDILGTTADLPTLISKYEIEHVFISLPLNRYHEARHVFDILSQSLVEVRLVADVPNLAGLSLTTSNLDGLPVVGLRESPHFGLNVVVKRAMDIVLSLTALVVLSPVMLLIALLVKRSSPGPVFYRQERCGLNGRSFQMLKFRSMGVDAEKQTGAVWARKDDPRRTAFGSFLRKTSLDELPQFINVLLGDMSLVGPRPERPVFIRQFSCNNLTIHGEAMISQTGITGWAQCTAGAEHVLAQRIQYDLYYITH